MLISKPISYLLSKVDSKFEYNPFEVSIDNEYSSTWQIKNNILFLEEIEFADGYRYKQQVTSILSSDNSSNVADWFNGMLIAYGGDPLWYKDGTDPVYEKELIFRIESEVVVDHEVIENEIPF